MIDIATVFLIITCVAPTKPQIFLVLYSHLVGYILGAASSSLGHSLWCRPVFRYQLFVPSTIPQLIRLYMPPHFLCNLHSQIIFLVESYKSRILLYALYFWGRFPHIPLHLRVQFPPVDNLITASLPNDLSRPFFHCFVVAVTIRVSCAASWSHLVPWYHPSDLFSVSQMYLLTLLL